MTQTNVERLKGSDAPKRYRKEFRSKGLSGCHPMSSNRLSTECSDQAIWELKIKLSSKGPAQVKILCLAKVNVAEYKPVLAVTFFKQHLQT